MLGIVYHIIKTLSRILRQINLFHSCSHTAFHFTLCPYKGEGKGGKHLWISICEARLPWSLVEVKVLADKSRSPSLRKESMLYSARERRPTWSRHGAASSMQYPRVMYSLFQPTCAAKQGRRRPFRQ